MAKRKRDQTDGDEVSAVASTPSATKDASGAPGNATAPTKSKGQSKQERSERRSKKKKNKHTDDIAAVPEQDADVEDMEEPTTKAGNNAGAVVEQDQGQAGGKPAKSSKAKTKSTGKQKTDDEKVSKTAARFIVFVGNLPYDATKEQVERHFEKLGTVSVRLSTDKATGRSKGFAFVEFDGYDKMKTCLKLYHHSMFNPQAKDAIDRSKAGSTKVTQEGRRINVELTAGGGGGKSEGRRAKIEAKNKKLDEQRSRRSEKERAEQQEAGQKKKQEQPLSEANATGAESKSGRNHGSIHPSRLARMKR